MSEKITFPMDNPLVSEAEETTKTKNEDHPDKKREELNRQAEDVFRKKKEAKEKEIRKEERAKDGVGTIIDTAV